MTDGFFSRPSLAQTLLGRLRPDEKRIRAALAEAGVSKLDAVVPVHTHYDHSLDSAAVAEYTGSVLIGGRSASQIALGWGLPAEQITNVDAGATIRVGAYDLTLIPGRHCPPDRWPGEISRPVTPPARVSAYRCGEAWSILVLHRMTRRRVLINGSAGYDAGALTGRQADVVYLGVAQLGVHPAAYVTEYWTETVRAVGARRVVLVHWDDFFRPLTQPLRALPYAGDDLDKTMRLLSYLADGDGVDLHLPTLWQREDPWAL